MSAELAQYPDPQGEQPPPWVAVDVPFICKNGEQRCELELGSHGSPFT
jgi:hypothetical protein